MGNNKQYSKSNTLPFGKHKGESIRSVIVHDAKYLEWCIENIEGFELDDEAYKMYETFLQPAP